ncbi:MAG: hypothetical protein KGR26_06005 [Cyanobacteria bacterium REEB65]|nr:hypothetical protein [Cyanobacteria bacterium REEB65]
MPKIRDDLPIRIKATGRRAYIVWRNWDRGSPDYGTFWVDLREGAGRRGFRYNFDGTPFDEGCPSGPIENFIPDDDPFESVEIVTPKDAYSPERLAAKRAKDHAAMIDAMGDSEAWGMF